jgi:hypothetical protein
MKGLRAVGAVGEGGVFVGPGRGRLEGEPAVFTTRVLAVRHALEGKNAASEEGADGAVCVLAMAERGVETVPDSWWTPVVMLSEPSSVEGVADAMPAVAERNSASRRVRIGVRVTGVLSFLDVLSYSGSA